MKNFKSVNTELIRKNAELETVLKREDKLTLLNLKVGDQAFPWVQGGCCDGKHLYEFMISEDSRHCIIVKYDLQTQEIVAYSEDMMLGHANDGAYNPNDNTLAIVHCLDLDSPTSNIVYIVDAETLTLKNKYELSEYDTFEITYNENTRQYITSSEKSMFYWSESFELLDKKDISITNGWPSQGIECDGEFVYRLEFFLGKGGEDPTTMKNNIHVNDIETGEEVALIPLNMDRESENIFIYDGKFHVSCNDKKWRGCEVYSFNMIEKK